MGQRIAVIGTLAGGLLVTVTQQVTEARERSRDAHTALRQAATGCGNPSPPARVVDTRSQST